jgi:chromosome segregation protein
VRQERELEQRRAALEARAEALRPAASPGGAGVDTLLGPLTDHVKAADGGAPALAALLGALGEALIAGGQGEAGAAIRSAAEGGGSLLVLAAVAPREAPDDPRAVELRAAGAAPALDLVGGDDRVVAALLPVLAGAWVVEELETACDLAARHPDLQFVTRGGALAGVRGYASGVPGDGAVLRRAAADEAAAEAERTQDALTTARVGLHHAEGERDAAAETAAAADRALQAVTGGRAGTVTALQRSRAAAEGARRELEARRGEIDALAAQIAAQERRLADLERRGPGEQPPEQAEQRGDVEAERLDDALAAAREAETQARLALGAAEQELREAQRRIGALEREAQNVEHRLAERERRRAARRAALARCAALAVVAAELRVRSEASLAQGERERDRLESERGARQRELGGLRARLRDAEAEREELVAQRHSDDLRSAERRQALASVRARIAALGHDPDTLVPGADHDGDEELAAQEADLERRVRLLGAVNPLAREEFDAVSERHAFLTEQVADVRRSRRDLEEVVAAVDARIREVFGAAFTDVAEQFTRLFPRLFPGGEGRLVLTDPDDLLTTGIEVEARPAGKRVKRLSLLSGGERSLTALAVLFAIFAARPSPFYVLDEVEAALDDVNLQRFLDVLTDFAGSAQLLIVTHQKRTMEIADTLYGVTMRAGVSRVVSQRMREAAVLT